MLHATCYEEYLTKVSRRSSAEGSNGSQPAVLLINLIKKMILKQQAKSANDVYEDCVCYKK